MAAVHSADLSTLPSLSRTIPHPAELWARPQSFTCSGTFWPLQAAVAPAELSIRHILSLPPAGSRPGANICEALVLGLGVEGGEEPNICCRLPLQHPLVRSSSSPQPHDHPPALKNPSNHLTPSTSYSTQKLPCFQAPIYQSGVPCSQNLSSSSISYTPASTQHQLTSCIPWPSKAMLVLGIAGILTRFVY